MENSMSRVRTPKQKRGQETKRQIIETGLRLFSEKGFHNTNSKEIALEAGAATGSFYAYFKDKKMLFIEILQEHFELIADCLNEVNFEDVMKKNNGRGLISAIVENVIKAHEISPGFHREIDILRNSDPDVDSLFSNNEKKILQNTVKMLYQYKENLRVKDIEAAAVIVNMSIEETVHIIKFTESSVNEIRMKNELVDMISRYLFTI